MQDVQLVLKGVMLMKDADMSQVALFISPAQRKAMLKIQQFTEAQLYGTSNIPSGVIGSVYGVPVVVSNNLAAQQYFMFEKTGLAIGFQKGLSMSEQGANEYGVDAKRIAMDQLFGIKGLQLGIDNGKGETVGATQSALIVKDAN